MGQRSSKSRSVVRFWYVILAWQSLVLASVSGFWHSYCNEARYDRGTGIIGTNDLSNVKYGQNMATEPAENQVKNQTNLDDSG